MTTTDRIYIAVCAYSAVVVARSPDVFVPGIFWASFIGVLLVAHWVSDRRQQAALRDRWQHAQANQQPPTVL
jgi:hypothetical protein